VTELGPSSTKRKINGVSHSEIQKTRAFLTCVAELALIVEYHSNPDEPPPRGLQLGDCSAPKHYSEGAFLDPRYRVDLSKDFNEAEVLEDVEKAGWCCHIPEDAELDMLLSFGLTLDEYSPAYSQAWGHDGFASTCYQKILFQPDGFAPLPSMFGKDEDCRFDDDERKRREDKVVKLTEGDTTGLKLKALQAQLVGQAPDIAWDHVENKDKSWVVTYIRSSSNGPQHIDWFDADGPCALNLIYVLSGPEFLWCFTPWHDTDQRFKARVLGPGSLLLFWGEYRFLWDHGVWVKSTKPNGSHVPLAEIEDPTQVRRVLNFRVGDVSSEWANIFQQAMKCSSYNMEDKGGKVEVQPPRWIIDGNIMEDKGKKVEVKTETPTTTSIPSTRSSSSAWVGKMVLQVARDGGVLKMFSTLGRPGEKEVLTAGSMYKLLYQNEHGAREYYRMQVLLLLLLLLLVLLLLLLLLRLLGPGTVHARSEQNQRDQRNACVQSCYVPLVG
jgi:hypothetical protein